MGSLRYTPSWKKYEEGMRHPDSEKQSEFGDKFITEREHELKTSKQARSWEKGRKEEFSKFKPQWKKEQIKAIREAEIKELKDLKNVGSIEYGLQPAPGYILVEPDFAEEKNIGGIIVPPSESSNTGTVLAIGTKLYCKHCFVSFDIQPTEPPVEVGEKIVFKKGAGAPISLKNKPCKLMMFSDILGVLI